jgi:hypothetical protein
MTTREQRIKGLEIWLKDIDSCDVQDIWLAACEWMEEQETLRKTITK